MRRSRVKRTQCKRMAVQGAHCRWPRRGEGDRWELMRIIGWGWYVGQRAAELIVYITSIYRRTYRGRKKEGRGLKF